MVPPLLIRVLSHLVRLPGPNPSSIVPPAPCPRWTAFVLFYLGLFAPWFVCVSSQQLFTPLLSNDGAGEGSKMHKIALCTSIYLLFFFLLSTIFYFHFFSQTTQHNIQNKTKQNSRHILNISRFNQKGGREGRTTRTQKLLL